MQEPFALDTLTAADTHACWQLSQALRWPHREADWQQFITWAKAHGAALAVRADGRLIGCGLAWQWGQEQGSIGMVIVDDAWQRRGIGKRLFKGLLQALEGRDVMLQATAQGRPLYESLGFAAIGHARQFHGHWQPPAEARPTVSLAADERTRLLQPQDLSALLTYDQRERGLARPALLQALLAQMDADERCAVSVDEQGHLCGYGILRRFGRGWVVGPLLADGADRAVALVKRLTQERTGDFIRIDLAADTRAFPASHTHTQAQAQAQAGHDRPSTQGDGHDADILAHWLQAHGLALVDQPTTMIRLAASRPDTNAPADNGPQDVPQARTATVCALAAQALG
mgnify:CR=1 FL=1